MFDQPSPMREHDLNRFWNDLVSPTGASEIGGEMLDPADAETLRHIQDLGTSPPPTSSRERVRRAVRANVEARANSESVGNRPDFREFPEPSTKPNGRYELTSGASARLRFPVERRRWLVAQFATAALLVVTLLAIYVAFLHNRPADSPATPIEATPQDVPFYRGNPARTGELPGPGPVGTPQERWRVQTGAEIRSAPAVVAGLIFVGGSDGSLSALDAATGAKRWTARLASAGPVSSPAVAGGLVYLSTDAGLFAINAASGEKRWRFPDARGDSSPAIVGGALYVGGSDGTLYALDAASGERRWAVATGGAISGSPAVSDGVVYAGSADGTLYALDAGSGEERWRFLTGGGTPGTPVVSDGTVYLAVSGGPANVLHAIDVASGTERWQTAIGAALMPPAVAGGMVYAGSDDGAVYAFDSGTGNIRWRFAAGGPLTVSPVIVGDTLFVGGSDAVLYAVNAQDRVVLWQFTLDAATADGPTVSGGAVYVGTITGSVYAIGGARASPSSGIDS